MRTAFVISLLFTLLLLSVTVISTMTYRYQNNDELINKVKDNQRQQQHQQQLISQHINHAVSRFKQLTTYLKQQSWQQTLTPTQRDDFIQFSDDILTNNSALSSISLIDYKNSLRLKIIAKTTVIENAPIAANQLNDIDHAFSLPANKTYINALPLPINHLAYYQHIVIGGSKN